MRNRQAIANTLVATTAVESQRVLSYLIWVKRYKQLGDIMSPPL
jgi:hypothetical protein